MRIGTTNPLIGANAPKRTSWWSIRQNAASIAHCYKTSWAWVWYRVSLTTSSSIYVPLFPTKIPCSLTISVYYCSVSWCTSPHQTDSPADGTQYEKHILQVSVWYNCTTGLEQWCVSDNRTPTTDCIFISRMALIISWDSSLLQTSSCYNEAMGPILRTFVYSVALLTIFFAVSWMRSNNKYRYVPTSVTG